MSIALPDNIYLHCLNLRPELGPTRLLKILNNFETFKDAYFARQTDYLNCGLEPALAEIILNHRLKTDPAAEAENLKQCGINILTYKDTNYSKLLLEIPKFPPILYYRGGMNTCDEVCMAVVGTRKVTTYGLSVIPDLVDPLVEAGITIVSGMAFGVDSQAHQRAILKKARTVAVLGGGLDDKSLYPKHHQLLAQEILDCGGALLSEYPPGTPNFKQNFVARNRIISGLSLGTLVVECDLDSGSLITARHALDQNRQVYAVPGPIYSEMSKGPNNLLKMGAKAVSEAKDILEDLNLKTLPLEIDSRKILGQNPTENKLLEIIGKQPVGVNEIIRVSGLDAGEVSSALTFLEIKGYIRNLGGQQYVRSH